MKYKDTKEARQSLPSLFIIECFPGYPGVITS